ncbi:MAG: PAS fold family protein, partial [Hyphomicrobiales bacterium]
MAVYYKDITGFIILLPAVALAGLSAGRIAGLASVFGSLCGGWLIVHLTNRPGAVDPNLWTAATINFLVVGVFLSLVSASLRKTLKRLDRSVQALSAYDARIDATEEELRAMVDQSSAGIARVDPEGRILS